MEKDTGGGERRGSYDGIAKWLHWLVAGAIALQFVLAKMAEAADEDGEKFRQLVLLANHKSVGITILGVAVVRLAWRLLTTTPPPLPMPRWQRAAAGVSHAAFYALLFVMPITGWIMSSASNISVSWFNLFQLPDPVPPSDDLESFFAGAHELFAKVLFLLAVLHVVAALKHSIIDRDGALRRISSPLGLVTFVLIVIAGLLLLVPESRAQDEPAPLWVIDYEASNIRFTAEQAGARFEGEWTDWSAEIRFNPSAPDAGSFDVVITVTGVNTMDEERDETLQDAEFFDGSRFPSAYYRATSFSENADGSFLANGSIEIKGDVTPAPLTFTVEKEGQEVVLDGSTRLDRLAIKVGTDEWEDTDWIGQFVDVTVHVEARVN